VGIETKQEIYNKFYYNGMKFNFN